MPEAPEMHTTDASAPQNEAQLVPAWLAILVLVLLLAVVGVGGYVIRGVVAGDRRAVTPEQVDVNEWRAEVKRDPSSPDAHLGLGYAHQQAKQYDKALKEYEKVLELDPRSTAALYNRGVVYAALDLDDKAEEAWWDVLEIDRTHALAAKRLGDLYAEKGHYKSLVKAVRPVVVAHPEMADLQYLMGTAYEHLGRPDWALARYRLALKYAPDMERAREGVDRLVEKQ